MTKGPPAKTEMPIVSLLPNVVTLSAICAGITAIRFGFQGEFETAIFLIIVAAFCDAIDGSLARLLNSESKMGAELDSLADFVNFGVAAPLLLYAFVLQEAPRLGWIAVLVFSVCCVIRLARFNVQSKALDTKTGNTRFTGVPAPAGAFLVLLPMFISFLFAQAAVFPAGIVTLWMIFVALLMISRVPTVSFKSFTVSRRKAPLVLLGVMVMIAALLTYTWTTLVIIDVIYLAGVFWTWRKAGFSRVL